MTNQQVILIQHSWLQIAPQTEQIAQSFYEELFELNPCLRSLFPRSFQTQIKKFSAVLEYMVSSIDQSDMLFQQLQCLGISQVSGLTKKQYRFLVGEALLRALRLHLSAQWSSQLARAWAAAYSCLLAIIQEIKVRDNNAVELVC